MKDNGLVQVASQHSVEETVKRFQSILAERAMQVFAFVDHSGEAEKVGLQMRPDGGRAYAGHRSAVESSGVAG
jgi:uncharacterized protein (DUF302 family)